MTTDVLKPDIHRLIDSIQDTQFLSAVYTILEKQASNEYDFWRALSPEQQSAIKSGLADAAAGRIKPMADVMRKYQ